VLKIPTLFSKFSLLGASSIKSWLLLGAAALSSAALAAALALAWYTPRYVQASKALNQCMEVEANRLKAESSEEAKRQQRRLDVRDAKAVADQKDSDTVRERIIWRTKYVQNPGALRCNTDQWMRLHDAASLGANPANLAELSPEGIAPVGDAEILDVVTRNYDTYRRVARERDACRAELASAYGQTLMP
jgi:hypothetical protein